ncbi:MAG TPA: LysR family transcriptional regulator [Burkholderiaceae bacterium]|nr:LysR family transcriptional regulator [Burkholderiaceae bacterium]
MPKPSRQCLGHGTLPQMAALQAILRVGSFAGTAREMHKAPPTVSGLVRKLADSAGTPLFRRSGRGVIPTAAGRRLCAAAAEILGALERASLELAALHDGRDDGTCD